MQMVPIALTTIHWVLHNWLHVSRQRIYKDYITTLIKENQSTYMETVVTLCTQLGQIDDVLVEDKWPFSNRYYQVTQNLQTALIIL